MNAPPPIILAMVPCSEVRRDDPQSLATLVDVIWSVHGNGFPGELTKLSVYIAATGFHGPGEFVLRWAPINSDDVGTRMTIGCDANDPLDTREITAFCNGWPVTSAGVWVFDLFWGDELVASRRIRVKPPSIAPSGQ